MAVGQTALALPPVYETHQYLMDSLQFGSIPSPRTVEESRPRAIEG